jgi:hypothetical protein
VKRGKDMFGKSEFFFGVSIKPRRVDFDLFHQSKDAENCYGPFGEDDLSDAKPRFGWAGPDRLIWEGFLDTSAVTDGSMVVRLEVYVGERDLFGIGFSDNKIYNSQVYLRAMLGEKITFFLHHHERFMMKDFVPQPDEKMDVVDGGWEFNIEDAGFFGRFRIEVDNVPAVGQPTPFVAGA